MSTATLTPATPIVVPVVEKQKKSKVQAEAAMDILRQGPATWEQLKQINGKYPSDPIYFARQEGHVIRTERVVIEVDGKSKKVSQYVLETEHVPSAPGVVDPIPVTDDGPVVTEAKVVEKLAEELKEMGEGEEPSDREPVAQ